ncbi:hypothetical protein DL96DRAFT_1719009 [Flagelloscypha sp. PMI_526]|nr:hypothetical protein DL96DRAFT_1719009 [Flagelloscypha sp. PMI_526]
MNFTSQVRSIATVIKAVANGDLSKEIEVEAKGEILELKNAVDGMVVRLRALAAEADVKDVEGVWFELVQHANRMCASLTDQVRSIAVVTTAVPRGDLNQEISIDFEGEMATLKGPSTLWWINFPQNDLEPHHVRSISVITKAVANGDLFQQVDVDIQGEMLELKNTVSSMVHQLRTLARGALVLV